MDSYGKAQELEADWLGASLLVPRDGLLAILGPGGSLATAATHFAVSTKMIQWRIKRTGIDRQLGYRAQAS